MKLILALVISYDVTWLEWTGKLQAGYVKNARKITQIVNHVDFGKHADKIILDKLKLMRIARIPYLSFVKKSM